MPDREGCNQDGDRFFRRRDLRSWVILVMFLDFKIKEGKYVREKNCQ
jgi:hypothetical protein